MVASSQPLATQAGLAILMKGGNAADAVWKFRYDPARDDDGRAIASKVEQEFILRR